MEKDEAKLIQIADEFRELWNANEPPLIEKSLNQVDADQRYRLAELLIPIDVAERLKSGDPPRATDYESLGDGFGQLAHRLIDELSGQFQQTHGPKPTTEQQSDEIASPQQSDDDATHYHDTRQNQNENSDSDAASDFHQKPDTRAISSAASDDATIEASDGSITPRTIGPYSLLRELGQGGMGSVWVAQQSEPVRRQVALKLVKDGIGSREILARFDAERQALAMMNHPNIARILDAGTTDDGQPFFVMELVEGVPLTDYCDKNRLTIDRRLRLFMDVCAGVQHAHSKGVIHRDLKPGNIIVTTVDGKPVPKVIDFGLAKAMESTQRLTDQSLFTGIGQILGTLKYMSPEQASLDAIDVDTRSDVYALGVILFELLTGCTPLDDESIKGAAILSVLELIREKDAPRPSSRLSTTHESVASITDHRSTDSNRLTRELVGDLDWIVVKALEKDRERRYETPSGFAADIQRYLDSEPIEARPPSASYRLQKFVRKNRLAVIAASLLAASLIAGVVGTSIGMSRALVAEHAAQQRAEGERVAKVAALESAEREKAAKLQAQKRLGQLEKGNVILNSVFEDLDINQVKTGSEPLEAVLASRLVLAADQLQDDALGDPLVTARLQSRLATSLQSLGYPLKALPLFEASTKTLENHLQPGESELLTAKIQLAKSQRAAGKNDFGIPLLNQILETQSEQLGSDHEDTLSTKFLLATSFNKKGDSDKAIQIHEQVLELRREKLGNNHSSTAASLNNLAAAYQLNGQLDKAIESFSEALEIDRKLLKPESPQLVSSVVNLGQCLQRAGKLKAALPLLKEALESCNKTFGSQHPTTLSAMNNLAQAYQSDKEFELAVELLEKVVEIRAQRLGPNHEKTLLAISNLAVFYDDLDDSKMALPLAQKALKFKQESLGPDHPSTLASMSNLTQSLRKAGKLDEAIPLLKETLELTQKKLGDEHIQTVTAMNNYAGGMVAMQNFSDAIPVFEETQRLMEIVLGDDHPSTFVVMGNLGLCYRHVKRNDEAIRILRDVFERKKSKFGPKNASTLTSQTNLAKAYQVNKQLDKAVEFFEPAYAILKDANAKSPNTIIVGASLAHCYSEQERFDDALPLLESALPLSIMVPQLNWVQPDLIRCYGNLNEEEKLKTTLDEIVTAARERYADDEKSLSEILEVFAISLVKIEKFAAAQPLLNDVLKYRKQHLPDDWRTFSALGLFGKVQLGLGKFNDAQTSLLAALAGLETHLEKDNGSAVSKKIRVVKWLIELAEATDADDDVKKWQLRQSELEEKLDAANESKLK